MDAKQVARWVSLGALFLIPLTPLIVANSFFFPFITGKAFFFRTLAEIAFAGWVVLAIADARYRPRFSYVEIAVLAFVGWMFIADLFAMNVMKAFWSNFERMEGWVLLAHLAAFFIAASTVLRVEGKWRLWFLWSLIVSLGLLFHGLLQVTGGLPIHQGSTRIDASLGNSTYFAVYLLFHTFIAAWLAFTEQRQWLKYSLLVLAVVDVIFIFLTQTRGTILGLIGALILAAILTALFSPGRPRQVAVSGLVAIVLVVSGFMAIRDTEAVRHSDLWNRIAHISLNDGAARFMIWGTAWHGFLERPIVGWGQEGFNYVFNKYYNPGMYAQEPWFDRAHNAFIDWLMAGGLPAFLLYIGLFITAIVMLWRGPLPLAERIALTSVFAAYAFHNLFVFDNISSYIFFFALLALVDSQTGVDPKPQTTPESESTATFTLPVVAAGLLVAIYFVNVSGMQVSTKLIQALSPQPGGVTQNAQIFADLTAQPSFAIQEIREQLVNFALQVVQMQSAPENFRLQVINLAVSEMKKQNEMYPHDARELLELSLAYRAAGDASGLFSALDAAIKESPKKQQIWLQKGVTLFELGKYAEAKVALDTAYQFDTQFPELAKYAAIGDFAAGDLNGGNAILAAHPEIVKDVQDLLQRFSVPSK